MRLLMPRSFMRIHQTHMNTFITSYCVAHTSIFSAHIQTHRCSQLVSCSTVNNFATDFRQFLSECIFSWNSRVGACLSGYLDNTFCLDPGGMSVNPQFWPLLQYFLKVREPTKYKCDCLYFLHAFAISYVFFFFCILVPFLLCTFVQNNKRIC